MRLSTGAYAGIGVAVVGAAFLASRRSSAAVLPLPTRPVPLVPAPVPSVGPQPTASATTVQARPAADPPTAAQVRVEQMQLNALGYGTLAVDGAYGSNTATAESAFLTNSGTGAAYAAAYAYAGRPNATLNAIDDVWRARNGQPAAPDALPPRTDLGPAVPGSSGLAAYAPRSSGCLFFGRVR